MLPTKDRDRSLGATWLNHVSVLLGSLGLELEGIISSIFVA